MKKVLITMLFSLLIPFVAVAQEAYAVYTTDGTLTFYYDKQKSSRSGTKYALNTGTNEPGWYTNHRKDIKKVVFTSSFSGARPKSTYMWFSVKAAEKESSISDIVGIQYLNTSEVTNMGWMFAYCAKLKELDVTHFNTNKVTNMSGMFNDCSSLKSLDVRNFNTDKVTSMSAMFNGCSSLTSLNVNYFNTSNVTNFWYMFKDCSSLKTINVTNFDTIKMTYFCVMFDGCSSLTTIDVSHFNTSNATRLNSMFSNCSSLTSLDLSSFNTSKVTGMSFMFSGCKTLRTIDLSSINSTIVTTMSGMFDDCCGLTSLDLSHLDTRNVTEMSWMFKGCTGLKSLDLSTLNTNKVTEMQYMFDGCTSLTTIYIRSNLSTNKVSESKYMFRNCTSLVGGAGTKYDANHVDKAYAHIDGGVSNPGYLTDKNNPWSGSNDDLQEFIKAHAAATGVVDVDLSKFKDVVREATLDVSTGASYRFINGKLDRAVTLNAPVMSISNNSQVQVADGALITGIEHITDDTSTETIRMAGGYMIVDGGTIEGSVGGRKYTNGVTVLGNAEYDPAVRLTSNSDHFILKDGVVYGAIVCDATNADVQLLAGRLRGMGLRVADEGNTQNIARRAAPMGSREPHINTRSDVYISSTTSKDYTWGYYWFDGEPEQNAFSITLYPTSKLYLKKHYDAGFCFHIYDKQEGDVVAIGDGYTLTDVDLQLMSVYHNTVYYTSGPPYTDSREPYLELKDNKVYLRYKANELPTTGCDEEWLQQKLDEIAEQKPSEPVVLTICEDGITLTKGIMVAKDCKAILTGGPVTSETTIDFRYGAEGLFMVYGELGFRDIQLDLKNDVKAGGNLGYFWLGDGKLQLLEGTEVNTTNGTVVGGWGTLDVTGATIMSGGNEMLFSSTINSTITDNVFIMGKQSYCNGKVRLEETQDPVTGAKNYPIFRLSDIYVTSILDLYAPYSSFFKVFLYKNAMMKVNTAGQPMLSLTGEWDKMTVGRAFVTSSDMAQKDYDLLTFSALPTNRRAEFVPTEHAVKLMDCGVQSLENGLNQLQLTVLPIGPGATNVLYNSTTIQGKQNLTIDGMTDGNTSRGRIHFNENQTLGVPSGHTLTLRNLDIDGVNGAEGIVVNGTLVISGNVHVSDFMNFIQIMNGGRIVVTGPLVSTVNIQFVNGAGSGQVVVSGLGDYQLTEQDLAFITVDGCELQLDTANNRIVVATSTGIESVTHVESSAEPDGYYDLSGRRVLTPRHGAYIMKKGATIKKIFIK